MFPHPHECVRNAMHLTLPSSYHANRLPKDLIEASTVFNVRANHKLTKSDQASDVCYGVKNGRLNLVYESNGVSSSLIDVLEPGQWVGTDDRRDPMGDPLTAVTATPCTLYVIRRTRMQQLAERSPEVREWLKDSAAARCARISERLHVMLAYDREARVRWAFNVLVHRFGCVGPRGRFVATGITQTDFARFAGTSRQTVNKIFAALKQEGQLALLRGHLMAPNRATPLHVPGAKSPVMRTCSEQHFPQTHALTND